MNYEIHAGNCLDILPTLPAQSVDAIIADPPYGTTACSWDSVIPFAPMWECIKHVIKPRGAVALFGQQPFTSALVMSNPQWYRYGWVWRKNRITGHANANKMPMKNTEDISVFYQMLPTYNPQGLTRCEIDQRRKTKEYAGLTNRKMQGGIQTLTGYPKTIIEEISAEFDTIHPTQKPTGLMSYLIRTYTNPGETVLDFTMGSGSTGVAALECGRKFIGIELDEHYYQVASERIEATYRRMQGLPRKANDTHDDLPLFADMEAT